jgi:hypothetical protein
MKEAKRGRALVLGGLMPVVGYGGAVNPEETRSRWRR